mmetsp:Transcript_27333/g.40415  ORF Transcript_27333/g.40415 Transcript_27333/m.40415 type:complete len:266 (+) Transcript_27333:693-1490(+)
MNAQCSLLSHFCGNLIHLLIICNLLIDLRVTHDKVTEHVPHVRVCHVFTGRFTSTSDVMKTRMCIETQPRLTADIPRHGGGSSVIDPIICNVRAQISGTVQPAQHVAVLQTLHHFSLRHNYLEVSQFWIRALGLRDAASVLELESFAMHKNYWHAERHRRVVVLGSQLGGLLNLPLANFSNELCFGPSLESSLFTEHRLDNFAASGHPQAFLDGLVVLHEIDGQPNQLDGGTRRTGTEFRATSALIDPAQLADTRSCVQLHHGEL